jgi:hypothetical protein
VVLKESNMNLVENTVERIYLPAGLVLVVRPSSPGSIGSVALAEGDAVVTPASTSGANPVSVGPFAVPVTLAVVASGTVSAEVASVAMVGSALLTPGGVSALSEVSPVAALTATGTAQTGAGTYRGIKVRAIVGGPQTITVYDALSATGTPIDTIVVNALGTWLWDRPSDVLPGVGGRRPVATGVHVVISGGTSRTVDVMVEAD